MCTPVGPSRSCAEFLVVCAAANAADPAITKVTLPTTTVVGLQTTSRGNSATEADRSVVLSGLKELLKVIMYTQ